VRYDIRISGAWSPTIADAFPDVEVSSHDGAIVLSADLDQAALHGLLERIRVAGLELIEVRRTRTHRV